MSFVVEKYFRELLQLEEFLQVFYGFKTSMYVRAFTRLLHIKDPLKIFHRQKSCCRNFVQLLQVFYEYKSFFGRFLYGIIWLKDFLQVENIEKSSMDRRAIRGLFLVTELLYIIYKWGI